MMLAAGVLAPSVGLAKKSGSKGKIDAFVVRERIHRDMPKINRCYENALRYAPELEGKVSVRFGVARQGHVKDVSVVENTTGSDQVGSCVTRVVGALRFHKRRYGKTLRFTFPFVFAQAD